MATADRCRIRAIAGAILFAVLLSVVAMRLGGAIAYAYNYDGLVTRGADIAWNYDASSPAQELAGPPVVGAATRDGYDDRSNLARTDARLSHDRSAPNTTGLADDAFTHGYRYNPRIRARGVQDGEFQQPVRGDRS